MKHSNVIKCVYLFFKFIKLLLILIGLWSWLSEDEGWLSEDKGSSGFDAGNMLGFVWKGDLKALKGLAMPSNCSLRFDRGTMGDLMWGTSNAGGLGASSMVFRNVLQRGELTRKVFGEPEMRGDDSNFDEIAFSDDLIEDAWGLGTVDTDLCLFFV